MEAITNDNTTINYRFTNDAREQENIPEVTLAISEQPDMYKPVSQSLTGAESHELDV